MTIAARPDRAFTWNFLRQSPRLFRCFDIGAQGNPETAAPLGSGRIRTCMLLAPTTFSRTTQGNSPEFTGASWTFGGVYQLRHASNKKGVSVRWPRHPSGKGGPRTKTPYVCQTFATIDLSISRSLCQSLLYPPDDLLLHAVDLLASGGRSSGDVLETGLTPFAPVSVTDGPADSFVWRTVKI